MSAWLERAMNTKSNEEMAEVLRQWLRDLNQPLRAAISEIEEVSTSSGILQSGAAFSLGVLAGHARIGPGATVDDVAQQLTSAEYVRGMRRALEIFEEMWQSGDWEGQCSMGFASTFDQEITQHLIDERLKGLT